MSDLTHLPLTEKETDVFVYILGYITDFGYSPTRQEIADRFGFIPAMAEKYIKKLVKKGKIKLIKKQGKLCWRNIVIAENKKLYAEKTTNEKSEPEKQNN